MDLVSRLLFPVPLPSYSADSFPGELLFVPRSLNPQTSSAEDFVPLLLLRAQRSRHMLVFLHSNSEDLGRCRSFCRSLRDELDVHVLAAEYPGYGVCPGAQCDERGAMESALTALRFVREVLRWRPEHILLLGRSIGTGPAIALAAEQPLLGGLILVSPFLSIREVCRDAFGPVANLIAERFPSQERMPLVHSPCLFIHGQRDATVLPRHSVRLHELCQARKRLVLAPAMDHNANLLRHGSHFVGPIRDFFGLPALGEVELLVPSWAFESRAAVNPLRLVAITGPPARGGCTSCTLARCTAQPCATCSGCHGLGPLVPTRPATSGSDFVEETIAGAVEHILASSREDPWSDLSPSSKRRAASKGPTPRGLPLNPLGPLSPLNSLSPIDLDDGEIGPNGPSRPHPTQRANLAKLKVGHLAWNSPH